MVAKYLLFLFRLYILDTQAHSFSILKFSRVFGLGFSNSIKYLFLSLFSLLPSLYSLFSDWALSLFLRSFFSSSFFLFFLIFRIRNFSESSFFLSFFPFLSIRNSFPELFWVVFVCWILYKNSNLLSFICLALWFNFFFLNYYFFLFWFFFVRILFSLFSNLLFFLSIKYEVK